MGAEGTYGTSHDWLAGGARRDASQARILEAATLLIAESGAAQLSIEDICDRVGCSRATLYRYVGGRPAIFTALIRQRVIPITEAISGITATLTGDAFIIAKILAAVHGIRSDPILLEVVKNVDREQMGRYLAVPETLAPSDLDRLRAKIIIRIVWSLLDYPIDDPVEERATVERFAAALRS